ncbi:MAG: SGNH/GDSL hydrolase family protein [Clostridia bacterium]|nr:SGNH/GDSL hydrolase family protein [Clostridia bacterium]
MILENIELKKLVSNCVKVVDSDDGAIRINRFTDKQLEIYKKEGFAPRAGCNAGVCFDFIYNGQDVSFEFFPVIKAEGRYLSFDLYEDDRHIYTFISYMGAAGIKKFEYSFDTAKERRIRIFFSYMCGLEVWNFTLDDGSTFVPTPTEGRKKILMLGDSITHGYDTYFISSYAGMVQTHYDAVSLNQGVGGYVFNAEMLDEELDFEPDAITVAYGTNDWTRYRLDGEKLRSEAKAYIDKLCSMYPNAKIFGILPLWRAETEKRKDTHIPFLEVFEILTECYSAHDNVTIIDGRLAVPNDVHFFTDGLHPNSVGHVLYGKHVICEMEKAGFHK